MADQTKVVYGLSDGATFNDLELPVTQFSRSRYTLTLNISLTVKDTAVSSDLKALYKSVIIIIIIIIMEGE